MKRSTETGLKHSSGAQQTRAMTFFLFADNSLQPGTNKGLLSRFANGVLSTSYFLCLLHASIEASTGRPGLSNKQSSLSRTMALPFSPAIDKQGHLQRTSAVTKAFERNGQRCAKKLAFKQGSATGQ